MRGRDLIVGSVKVISDEDLQRIHHTSLKLLEEHGMRSDSNLILDIFKKAGANVDLEKKIIRLSPDMVRAALKSAPKSFVFYGRDPKMDLMLEPGCVYYGMGGTSEPYIWDYDSKGPRNPTKADMVNNTRIGQESKNIDFVSALCSAANVPPKQTFLHEYDAIFRNTSKPVLFTAPGRFYGRKFFEMAMAASGGEDGFRKRPCAMLYMQTDSPMQINQYSESMVDAAEIGAPILVAPGAMMGATGPVTVAGDLAQINAEALLGIVLTQVIKPGTPVVYGPHCGPMDMITGQVAYGSAEGALGRVAIAQLGRFYNLPTLGIGGGVEAKLPDAEAASQAMMGMLINALSGIMLTQSLGTMASGLYGSPEMLLICDEMALMIKRILAGFSVSDETLAFDVIKEVGQGGEFLTHDHTVRFFRQELFFPVLFRRQSVGQWVDGGSKSVVDLAHERSQEILSHAGPIPLPKGADRALEETLRKAVEEVEKMSSETREFGSRRQGRR